MNLKVLFKGPISLVAGEELDLNLPAGARIRELISVLRKRYMEEAERKGLEAVFRDFEAQNLILVNDREISALNGMETELGEGDIVRVINFTHGG